MTEGAHQPDKETGCHSLTLLDLDGLMSPILFSEFGRLFARQISSKRSGGAFTRRSSIFQKSTGQKILDATLEISLAALPAGFLEKLTQSEELFGQLLSDFGIKVRISDKSVYSLKQDGHSGQRWGRRLSMYRQDTDELLCRVDELLVSETLLFQYRQT
ncbi:hypothetical protein [Tabrizicola sp.]|uniref:hypothetical protein n=1 Tax=Tabrizicola sp. TaxID=2005166 RepID=UPI00286CB05C|nr:hypothetical protein [Tabrizicola sp.]